MFTAIQNHEVPVAVGFAPGNYVVMSMLETDGRIPDGTCVRLFEWFLTTEERGHGTGPAICSCPLPTKPTQPLCD